MAKDDSNEAKVMAGLGIGAAVAGLFHWLRSRAQGPGQVPDELAKLIAAMAAAIDRIDKNIATLGINVQGWPPNVKYLRAFTLVCVAVNQAYQAPPMAIPDGMSLAVKGHPLNVAASLVMVASSAADCININSSWPLAPNEAIAFAIENAEDIYVSTNVAGSRVIFVAEERR